MFSLFLNIVKKLSGLLRVVNSDILYLKQSNYDYPSFLYKCLRQRSFLSNLVFNCDLSVCGYNTSSKNDDLACAEGAMHEWKCEVSLIMQVGVWWPGEDERGAGGARRGGSPSPRRQFAPFSRAGTTTLDYSLARNGLRNASYLSLH